MTFNTTLHPKHSLTQRHSQSKGFKGNQFSDDVNDSVLLCEVYRVKDHFKPSYLFIYLVFSGVLKKISLFERVKECGGRDWTRA